MSRELPRKTASFPQSALHQVIRWVAPLHGSSPGGLLKSSATGAWSLVPLLLPRAHAFFFRHSSGLNMPRCRAVPHLIVGFLTGLWFAVVAPPRPLVAAPPIPHAQDRPPGPPRTPAEALASFKVPAGFSVELVASEPQLVNPVAMCFDERGRIWVCESVEYPRRSPGPGQDRVKVLEDTDHDGRVDKVTLFADGLNIPSGIAVGHGGVWVANAPDLLLLRDTDGDLVADTREVVVTGFGRFDTHELPNSLVFGPDGWLYGLNGVFNGSRIEHQGQTHEFTCAMFRLHPQTRRFELFAEGTSNPWGIAFDREGSAFLSACVIDHLWHIVQSGYYHRQAGAYPPHTWKIESIVQHKHQKAAYCGITHYDSDAYPPEWRGLLFMGNIHGNCVNVDRLRRAGSTYFATGEPDFLSTDDAWFMPVSQKTGPDGCLYVLDWYDQYHCYQDANRDPQGIERAKGRLYRVRYRDTPRAGSFDLAAESDAQLIARLNSGNGFFRETAQRVLAERQQASTTAALAAVVARPDAPRPQRLHAAWALASHPFAPERLATWLADRDPAVRAHAIRQLANQPKIPPALAQAVAARASDESPDVRLQVAIAAGRGAAGDNAVTVLLDVLARSAEDPLIPRVVWANLQPRLAANPAQFLSQWQQQTPLPEALATDLVPRLFDRLLDAEAGGDAARQAVADLATDTATRLPTVAPLCLDRLAAKVQNRELSGKNLRRLRDAFEPLQTRLLAEGATGPAALSAALLATSWGDDRGRAVVGRALTDTTLPNSTRIRALRALVAVDDERLHTDLPALLRQPAGELPAPARQVAGEFQAQVLGELARLKAPQVADAVLVAWPELAPELQPRAVELLTQRVAWARALLAAMGRGTVPTTVLGQNQVRRLLATRDADLAADVARHWGTIREGTDLEREARIAEFRAAFREEGGDPERGRAAYNKVCGQCHKLHGEGAEVGPDLTLNGRSSFDQLLSNVFDPSLVIGAAYQARTILTKGGRVVTGLVVEESPARVVLKLQGGKPEVIPVDEIDEQKTSELSLMPDDVHKTLTRREQLDLFALLTLDKPPADPQARSIPGLRDTTPREATEPAQFGSVLAEVAPGFVTRGVGEGGLGLLRAYAGRDLVLRTHPIDRETPCVLQRTVAVPPTGGRLKLAVAHDRRGDWQLIIRGNDRVLLERAVSPEAGTGWIDLDLDLAPFAGQSVSLSLENHPSGWSNEFGYWQNIRVEVPSPAASPKPPAN